MIATVLLGVACFFAGWLVHRLLVAGLFRLIAHLVGLALADPSRMTQIFTALRGALNDAHPSALKNLPRCPTCEQPCVTTILDAPAPPKRA